MVRCLRSSAGWLDVIGEVICPRFHPVKIRGKHFVLCGRLESPCDNHMQGQRYCSCEQATFGMCIIYCFCGAGPHVNESIMIPRDTFDVASFSVLCSEAILSLPFPSEVRQLLCGQRRASTMWGSPSACQMSFNACPKLVACWGGHLMRRVVATWDNSDVDSANIRCVAEYAVTTVISL